jgi:CRP-like cAMP-binding protein
MKTVSSMAECASCTLRKKKCFRQLSPGEVAVVSRLKIGEQEVSAGRTVIRRSEPLKRMYTLTEGWAARYYDMPDGSSYLIDVVLPGENVGHLYSLIGTSGVTVRAITHCRFCVLDSERIPDLFDSHSSLRAALIYQVAAVVYRLETKVCLLSHGSASRRLAFLFLDVFDRLRLREMISGTSCQFPFTRADLSSALGISEVHVSRTLASFRRKGLATLEKSILRVQDYNGLRQLAPLYATPFRQPALLL